ncbi:PKD domain-containing protein [Spirosoma sp. BT702]|uniref:PKD domain-containing protein n=1 Tax=Spirosoma profusum TaxID=2771354 RepID=A0A927GA28_9BACT|nr:PKD domain-containing protein [Spirosoma profusum]MBD2704874.1 PKD domain-containing protein [Spirosoma profusum]
MKPPIYVFILVTLASFSCKKTEDDMGPVVKPSGLFTYRAVPDGDGTVAFAADSSQQFREFSWDFGDGTTATLSTPKTVHIFKKNTTYQVRLVAKNNVGQVAETKSIAVTNRFARVFEDLPASERDTIRVLYVLTSARPELGYRTIYDNPDKPLYDLHLNRVFTQFLQRSLSGYPTELDRLVFKGIPYVLSPEDTLAFYNNNDPDAFFRSLMNKPQHPLYQKILAKKRQAAAARVVFMMVNPLVVVKVNDRLYSTAFKYNYAGYANYEAGYIAAFDNLGVVTHEMGHSFGLMHETQRDSRYRPLMSAPETQVIGGEPGVYNIYREFQYKGTEYQLGYLRQPNDIYAWVPQYWQSIVYPNSQVIATMTVRDIATTPYYKPGITLATTLTQALVDQYLIKVVPGLTTSLLENAKPNGRQGIDTTQPTYVACPLRQQ